MSERNNPRKSGYNIDPRFGKHDPRESPLGRAAATLLEKIHKQSSSIPQVTSSNNKPSKK